MVVVDLEVLGHRLLERDLLEMILPFPEFQSLLDMVVEGVVDIPHPPHHPAELAVTGLVIQVQVLVAAEPKEVHQLLPAGPGVQEAQETLVRMDLQEMEEEAVGRLVVDRVLQVGTDPWPPLILLPYLQ